MKSLWVCTDLDGSLLDHSYRWDDAKPALEELKKAGIPLILNSSKTLAEMVPLAKQLGLDTPLVCENGGVVAIPEQSPLAKDLPGVSFEGYMRLYPGVNRDYLLHEANSLREQLGYRYQGFSDWNAAEVAEKTGLNEHDAAASKFRFATEPILWSDSDRRLQEFRAELEHRGISLVQGGRFLHIMGQVNKSDGMAMLLHQYHKNQPETTWLVLALGDSANDLEMLSAADIAGVIPHMSGALLEPTSENVVHASLPGPAGWNEIVLNVLKEIGVPTHG